MSLEVVPSHQLVTVPRNGRAVSPELVLVDPVLAASARERLPDAGDSCLRAARVRARPLRCGDATVAFASVPAPALDVASSRIALPVARTWAVVAGIAVAIVVGLLLPDVHVARLDRDAAPAETIVPKPPAGQSDGTPTPAHSSSGPGAPAGRGGRPARNSRAGIRPAVRPRRFAWAPAPGPETGYHVELFRAGNRRCFRPTPEGPQLTVPARWKHAGKSRSLRPGEYRWYVWPSARGAGRYRAVVQAKLAVMAP